MSDRIMIVKRAINIRMEIAQIFLDAEHWNREHPAMKPIDVDPDNELKKLAARLDTIIESNLGY